LLVDYLQDTNSVVQISNWELRVLQWDILHQLESIYIIFIVVDLSIISLLHVLFVFMLLSWFPINVRITTPYPNVILISPVGNFRNPFIYIYPYISYKLSYNCL